MKVEMLESLGYSYLRHVRDCWIVQVNWKAADGWPMARSSVEMNALFRLMKRRFDEHGDMVFKGTKSVQQFLKQAEIDVFGVDFDGGVHALEVAFHEGGLNYGSRDVTRSRILKKLLRTYLMLVAFEGFGGQAHVYFVSPKAGGPATKNLEEVFATLRQEYPEVDWRLAINEAFHSDILQPTLEANVSTSDTTELFVRAVRLFQMGRRGSGQPG